MNGLHHRLLGKTWVQTTDVVWGSVGAAMLIYGASALVGVWAAYDRTIALERLVNLLMGLALVLLLIWYTRRDGVAVLYHLCRACAVLTGVVSLYFLLFHDWTAGQKVDFAPFQAVALVLQQLRPQLAPPLDLHENLVANILSVLMPLSAGGAILARTQGCAWSERGAGGALMLGATALVMTFSRGAWMGLGAGLFIAFYLYWRTGAGRQSAGRIWGDLLVGGGVAALLVLFALLLMPTVAQKVELLLPVGSTPATHLRLWQDSLSLIRDYRYTGSGLGVSTMVYSTYYFLVHVAYLHHAHNLVMQIGVEQGLPGMIGFLGVVGGACVALWRALHSSSVIMRKAGAIGAASLSTMMLHGLTEAELYAGQFALLSFLPVGFALSLMQLEKVGARWAICRPVASIGGVYSTWQAGRRVVTGIRWIDEVVSRIAKRQMMGWLVGAVPIAIIVGLLFVMPGSAGSMWANWGAVMQTRTELTAYQWPEWPVQDAVRRMQAVNLDPAAAEFRAALALDPDNVTANRRLGQLALSIGQYDVAHRRLQAAYALSPSDQTTRQLLGELYAIQGDVEQSASLWRLTPADLYERLYMRKWWYEYLHASQEAEWLNASIARVQRLR